MEWAAVLSTFSSRFFSTSRHPFSFYILFLHFLLLFSAALLVVTPLAYMKPWVDAIPAAGASEIKVSKKRGRNEVTTEIIEVKQEELMENRPREDEAKLTGIAFGHSYGPIPEGTRLTKLNITSYEGNPGLCGDPLPKKCGNPKAPQLPPPTVDEGDSSSAGIFEFDWKIVSAGCGSGLVVGVVLADVVITRRPDLFLKIVGMIRQMI
ncbi:hypothetical protein FF2_039944 [Malus domestica]